MSEKSFGLFTVCYQIGGLLGAPDLNLSLVVNTVANTVNGSGVVSIGDQHTYSNVHGTYTYMATMKDVHILVVATGYPVFEWPPHDGIGPALPPNLHLRMILTQDWARGTANFKFRNSSGTWIEVKDAPVERISCAIQEVA